MKTDATAVIRRKPGLYGSIENHMPWWELFNELSRTAFEAPASNLQARACRPLGSQAGAWETVTKSKYRILIFSTEPVCPQNPGAPRFSCNFFV